MTNIQSAKRNYFVIGSVLTFFVVGGMTLYAKTGSEGHSIARILGIDDSSRSGLEEEVEIEHGVVTTSTTPHGGDDSRSEGSDDDVSGDEGLEYEVEVEHGVTTIVAKPHGGDDSDDDGEDRGRGRDDDDDEDDDHRPGQSGSGSVAPSPVPTPPTPVAPTTKTFTMADVAAHANGQSCYTTISGNVYDVTPYIPVHRGGSAAILAICGKDGSSLFSGQHAGAPKPEQALAGFKIGTLAP